LHLKGAPFIFGSLRSETKFFPLRGEKLNVSIVSHRSDSSDAGNPEVLRKWKNEDKRNGTKLKKRETGGTYYKANNFAELWKDKEHSGGWTVNSRQGKKDSEQKRQPSEQVTVDGEQTRQRLWAHSAVSRWGKTAIAEPGGQQADAGKMHWWDRK
jgi:hypothetical protein